MSSQRKTRSSTRLTAGADATPPPPPPAPSNSTRNRRRRAAEVEEVEDDADFRSPVGVTASSSGARRARATQSAAEREAEATTSDSDQDNEEYGDLHRMVLQGIMKSGYLDAKSVKKLFTLAGKFLEIEIPEGSEIYPYIQKVVTEINDEIKAYDMAIKSATCEITEDKYYVYLVTMDNPIMKYQTYFSKVELDLFKKIMNSLLRDHVNFAMSRMECLNLTHDLDIRAFSKLKAENFIDKMIDMKYFIKIYKKEDMHLDEKDRDYDITLGFRAIRELEQTLRDVYGSIFESCCLCKSILLNGLQCPNAECDAVIHRRCVKKFLKNCNSCVSCKTDWKSENDLPVRTRDSVVDEEADPSSPSTVDSSASGSDDGGDGGREEGADSSSSTSEESPEPAVTSSSSKKSKAPPKGRKKKEEPQAPPTPTRSSARRRTRKAFADV